MEYLLPYLCMVTVPHIMVGLQRMLDYRGVGLARFHCILFCLTSTSYTYNDCLYMKILHNHFSIKFHDSECRYRKPL